MKLPQPHAGYLSTVLSTTGHVMSIMILIGTSLTVATIECLARSFVKLIAWGTGAAIAQDKLQPHRERVLTFQQDSALVKYLPHTGADGGTGPDQVIDEKATYARTAGAFPLSEQQLVARCHALITSEFGGLKPELLAEDFQFVFPVVGPLTKAEFLEAFTSFKVREAFPDSRSNFYNFNIDPLEPNRVWCLSRGRFRHTGTLHFGPSKYPATNEDVCLPPQCFSMSFDHTGRCYKLTGGYCVDRSVGDTNGLGGMFGILTALGGSLPFPEGRPWQRSLMWEALSLRLPQILKDWQLAAR